MTMRRASARTPKKHRHVGDHEQALRRRAVELGDVRDDQREDAAFEEAALERHQMTTRSTTSGWR